MKIEFMEDIDVALRKRLDGRVVKRRRLSQGEVHHVEFLGENSDLETMDFQFEDGLFAIKVPRYTIGIGVMDFTKFKTGDEHSILARLDQRPSNLDQDKIHVEMED